LLWANGRSFTDFAELNTQGHLWLNYTANVRLHVTTGRKPVDLWPQEKLTVLTSVRPISFAPGSRATLHSTVLCASPRSRS
jgi:hypothetical protein